MYQIIDHQTGATIGKPYKNRTTARNKADKLDNAYGAYRYYVKELLNK